MVLDVCVHLSQPLNVEESEDEFDIDEIKLFARHRYVVEKPITKYNWLNGESMTWVSKTQSNHYIHNFTPTTQTFQKRFHTIWISNVVGSIPTYPLRLINIKPWNLDSFSCLTAFSSCHTSKYAFLFHLFPLSPFNVPPPIFSWVVGKLNATIFKALPLSVSLSLFPSLFHYILRISQDTPYTYFKGTCFLHQNFQVLCFLVMIYCSFHRG